MNFRKLRSDPRLLAGMIVLCTALGLSGAQAGTAGINRAEHLGKPYVILVSLDGFRADYLDRFRLPNLRRVMQRGTRARWMTPVFPTLTFPNHYSLVTGMHPEQHGIVGNSFYDPARRQKYSGFDENAGRDGSWYRAEPIWVTAETQGMVAACFFWPGSEAAIKDVRPTFSRKYDDNVPNGERVKTVVEWLKLPAEKRPHMITLYFSDVDSASHGGSLNSPRVQQAAREVDRSLGELLDGIDALPVKDRVYVLVTSDHGMADTTHRQSISIESLTSLDGVVQTFVGPVTNLHVGGNLARATTLRDRLNARLTKGRAYLRQDLPARFHYSADPRAGDVVVVMDEGWTLRRALDLRSVVRRQWATHGWDPELPSMRAIFLAMGPGIRAAALVEPVDNVDVYPLMAELLGLAPAAGVAGRPGHIRKMISN